METLIPKIKKLYWDIRRAKLKGILYSMRYMNIPFGTHIGPSCLFRNLQYLKAGKAVFIDDNANLNIKKARNCANPQLIIGNHVTIGRYNIISCTNKVILEDYVLLAPFVHITDYNHVYEDIKIPISNQGLALPGPTIIKSHSWLGCGVQVMPGVTIGKHCVIGAGSIVTHDIPDYCVAAGIPAKIIKKYDHNTQEWVSVHNQNIL